MVIIFLEILGLKTNEIKSNLNQLEKGFWMTILSIYLKG